MRTVLAVLMLVPCLGLAQQTPMHPELIPAGDIDWPPAAGGGPVRGAQSVFLVGSAAEEGLYVQRVKMASDALIAPHTHSDERVSFVLEGSIFVGFGDTFDADEVVEIPAGSMYVAPAGVAHYVWAGPGTAIYQETGKGPSVTRFITQGPD